MCAILILIMFEELLQSIDCNRKTLKAKLQEKHLVEVFPLQHQFSAMFLLDLVTDPASFEAS